MRLLLAISGLLLVAASPQWGQTSAWHSGIAKVSAKNRTAGTAFVVALKASSAYLVTSAHVVEGDSAPQITFVAASDRSYRAEVRDLEAGDERGLALLVVSNPPSGVTVVPASGEQSLELQSKVDVAGFPAPFSTFTVVDTTVATRKGRDIMLARDTGEGFSGGPVVLAGAGAVVGLVFGREQGFGKMLGTVNIRDYLTGHGVSWSGEPPRAERVKPVPPGPQPGDERVNPRDGLTYVWVPPGKFIMGCSPGDKECYEDESSAHSVTISKGFWLGKSEVTQAAYQKVTGTNPSDFKGANRPVEQVSWNDARSYCEKIGGRLPREAEWEYAARAGSTAARYGQLDDIAWYKSNSGSETHDVMTRTKNAFGLHDMIGNVYEWVNDWYAPYESSAATDPNGQDAGTSGTVRGGAWNDTRIARASYRAWVATGFQAIGFRCVGEIP